MKREEFNENWSVTSRVGSNLEEFFVGGENEKRMITLPHDAMIHEKRMPETKNGSQTGFYPGGIYQYKKTFLAPKIWEGKTIILEFEGAYINARVYINGDYVGGYPNGYSNFYICADHFLKYGEENEIVVDINNGMESNSRWYSGSGLYRNVKIMVGNPIHIPVDGIRISTPEIDDLAAVAAVDITIRNKENKNKKIRVETEIRDEERNLVAAEISHATVFGDTQIKMRQRMVVSSPKLWDCDHPNIYYCAIRIMDEDYVLDEENQSFGFRKLQLDAVNGLRINGKGVKLRGACIHHDNGVIGACTLERAEERRCAILKEAGFNCIRSAHHPISKAMLDACDRQGMLVMDELSDMWTSSKNNNDYAMFFPDYWEQDVELMVAKDFNHPSVILYSTGNEIQEAGTAKGAELNRKISNKIRSLDDTRYTTNGINGMVAILEHMEKIMSDIMGKQQEGGSNDALAGSKVESEADKNEGGSDALNSMMGMLHGPVADAIATHPIMTKQINEFVDGLDIAGYNYMTSRHAFEHQINPNRVIIGAETFPADIVRLWGIVKKNPHVLGDMTWIGYDHLGEAGAGIFYYDGTANFTPHWPDRVSYVGDIDITGYRRPISYLREVVYGLRKAPYIAVERLDRHEQKTSKTPWMWKNNIASWTWPGYEGQPASIDVCADAEEVELFLNNRSLGRKTAGEAAGYIAHYDVIYESGELKAVCHKSAEGGCHILRTASDEVELHVKADRTVLKADGADLSYITVGLEDKDGNENLYAKKQVTVKVEGNGCLQGFGSADPQAEGSYDDTTWITYDGYVLAVVRAGKEAGVIKVSFGAEGCKTVTQTIIVKS